MITKIIIGLLLLHGSDKAYEDNFDSPEALYDLLEDFADYAKLRMPIDKYTLDNPDYWPIERDYKYPWRA